MQKTTVGKLGMNADYQLRAFLSVDVAYLLLLICVSCINIQTAISLSFSIFAYNFWNAGTISFIYVAFYCTKYAIFGTEEIHIHILYLRQIKGKKSLVPVLENKWRKSVHLSQRLRVRLTAWSAKQEKLWFYFLIIRPHMGPRGWRSP